MADHICLHFETQLTYLVVDAGWDLAHGLNDLGGNYDRLAEDGGADRVTNVLLQCCDGVQTRHLRSDPHIYGPLINRCIAAKSLWYSGQSGVSWTHAACQ